jgi:Tfp pilus assembly protein PilF
VRDELEIEPDPRIEQLVASLSRPRARSDAVPSSKEPATARPPETSADRAIAEVQRPRRSRTWLTTTIAIALIAAIGSLTLFQRARARPVTTAARASAETINSEAKELYLRGINAWSNRSKDALDSAVIHFRKAIEIEPDYAEAYGGLANAYVLLGYSGYRPASAMFPKAKAAALHAIELDSTLASPYAALGLELTWERKFADAETAFRTSIARDPGYATAHQWYGMLFKILGRIDEAVRETGRAAELDPLSLQIQNTYATFLSSSGNPAAALAQYEKVVGEEPDSAWVRRNPWLLTNMSAVYAENGMMDKALAAAERSVEINPRHPRSLEALADVHIRMGHPDVARQIFARVDTTNEHYTAQLAFFYLDLGMRDSAFAAFDRVKDWPIPIMIALGGNKTLAGDPRYAMLLQKLGIPLPVTPR